MTDLVDFRGLDAPIVQAGMGAVARHELAAAVSEAGGFVARNLGDPSRRASSQRPEPVAR